MAQIMDKLKMHTPNKANENFEKLAARLCTKRAYKPRLMVKRRQEQRLLKISREKNDLVRKNSKKIYIYL